MKAKKRTIVIIAILITIALSIATAAAVISYRTSRIPSLSFMDMLSYTTRDNNQALLSVGIIKDGHTKYTVYGENATILPSHEHTYEIGSISKTFTAALLGKAIHEGTVALSDTIDQYIELPKKNHYPDLHQLVTHTSGYKNYYFEPQMMANRLRGEKNDYYGISVAALDKKLANIRLKNNEHAFLYSNFGYSVLGRILSKVQEKEFPALMQSFIAQDLKLKNTHIAFQGNNLPRSWNWAKDDAYIPAGALVSTIEDMLQYVQIHLDGNIPYLDVASQPTKNVQATTKKYEKMGIRIDSITMGWMFDEENNVYWHNGATSNYNSYIAFDTDKQVGVVILSNLAANYRIPATLMGLRLITSLQDEDAF